MLGWLGNVFIVIGLWKVGNRDRVGFVYSLVGEAVWCANASLRGDWALATITVVFFVMALRGLIKWRS